MVSVSEPHDELDARGRRDARRSTVTGRSRPACPADDDEPRVARRARPRRERSRIELHKDIPPGAGLGGGSADAAAVLVGARRPDRRVAIGAAASLGADVPFCLRGGATRVRGIGDELEPVDVAAARGRDRDAAVRLLDRRGVPRVGRRSADRTARRSRSTAPAVRNDLERAAHAVEPRLPRSRLLVEDAAGAPAILAGSGSSYALLFDDDDEAEAARARRHARSVEGHVVVGHTIDAGVRIVT